jgi:CubicO group peptidase (beta-lactamase class C family)
MRRLATALGAFLSLAGAARAAAPAIPPPPPAEVAGFAPERLKVFDALMARQIATGEIAGSVILLVRHGKPVLFKSYGLRDLADPAPMRRDAIFRIRSQTKPVTAVAMMMLYEQGLWKLDDPVTKFVPEFSDLRVASGVDAEGKPVLAPLIRPPTMRELMTHTAGFAYGLAPDGVADKAYFDAGVLRSANAQEMVIKVAGLPMISQPGVRWYYSAAADIQGAIVEKLSGLSLAQFMGERIFTPLGMSDTAFYVPPEKAPRLASLYDLDPVSHQLVRQPERDDQDIFVEPGYASGGGGLMSTARDYGRFCQMILGGGELNGVRLLKPETVALMRQNHLAETFMVTSNGTRASPLGTGIGFGLGWAVWFDPAATGAPVGAGTVSWGGSAGSWFWIDPKNDLYFVGMIQRLGGTGGGMDAATRSITYQALVDPRK